MTKDEALALALEALEYAQTGNRRPEIIGTAITAIKQAQQAQEPVGINGLTEAETNATMSVMGLSKRNQG